ncbi:MAG: hypothetical protein APR55_04200 [Methanolinea sp. SDB]|nr:MAG: hypothetical protein APR55_04200 [Methanolinea sp. SDB]
MNSIRTTLVFLTIIFLLLGAGCLENEGVPVTDKGPCAGDDQFLLALDQATLEMENTLSGIDASTSDAANALGTTGLSRPRADWVLDHLSGVHPGILTAITFDPDGTVLSAEPEDARVLIGQDIGYQETVSGVLDKKEPMMSRLFPLAQGGYGVVIEYPVFSADGTFSGAVSTAFVPYDMIAPILENATDNTPYSFMVLQTDGRILYDPDPEEVGKETLNETLYADFPEIFEVMNQLSVDPSGHTTYSFYDTGFGKIVRKECYWETVGLHGMEWRVMIIREIEKS